MKDPRQRHQSDTLSSSDIDYAAKMWDWYTMKGEVLIVSEGLIKDSSLILSYTRWRRRWLRVSVLVFLHFGILTRWTCSICFIDAGAADQSPGLVPGLCRTTMQCKPRRQKQRSAGEYLGCKQININMNICHVVSDCVTRTSHHDQ